MKITLVRHAQTEENFKGNMQGKRNILLNDTGRRQCNNLRLKLKDKKYDYCYMSPLVRCVETAFILIGDRVEMIRDDRLIERELGEYEGRPREEYNAYKYWDYDLNCDSRGVEPVQDVFKRCKSFLDYISEKHKDESILIVTHGSPYRALRFLIKTVVFVFLFLIDSCSIDIFGVIVKYGQTYSSKASVSFIILE